jgi:hypothetical protein
MCNWALRLRTEFRPFYFVQGRAGPFGKLRAGFQAGISTRTVIFSVPASAGDKSSCGDPFQNRLCNRLWRLKKKPRQ